MDLDPVAREVVLASIRRAIPATRPAIAREMREMARTDSAVILHSFLDGTGLELDDIYPGRFGWSDLCEDAGPQVAAAGDRRLRDEARRD